MGGRERLRQRLGHSDTDRVRDRGRLYERHRDLQHDGHECEHGAGRGNGNDNDDDIAVDNDDNDIAFDNNHHDDIILDNDDHRTNHHDNDDETHHDDNDQTVEDEDDDPGGRVPAVGAVDDSAERLLVDRIGRRDLQLRAGPVRGFHGSDQAPTTRCRDNRDLEQQRLLARRIRRGRVRLQCSLCWITTGARSPSGRFGPPPQPEPAHRGHSSLRQRPGLLHGGFRRRSVRLQFDLRRFVSRHRGMCRSGRRGGA